MSTIAEHLQNLIARRAQIQPGENPFLLWDDQQFKANALLLCTTHLDELASLAAPIAPEVKADSTEPLIKRLQSLIDDGAEVSYGTLREVISALGADSTEAESLSDAALTIIAACREAFPPPSPGSPVEGAWMQAIGDPESVPGYLRAIAAHGGKQ